MTIKCDCGGTFKVVRTVVASSNKNQIQKLQQLKCTCGRLCTGSVVINYDYAISGDRNPALTPE